MLSKITERELKIFQTLKNPISLSEILFSDFDNLGEWNKDKFGKIRICQYKMLSHDSEYINDPKLSKKENFEIKKGMAESYNFGGRLTGKSIISIVIDVLNSIFNKTFKLGVVASLDADHVNSIMEKILGALENHKVLKQFLMRPKRNPYRIPLKNGLLIESVNDNINSKNPGGHFFSKHVDRIWREECSFLTPVVSSKQLMAQSELGCINRWSGMSTFTKNSPVGKIFCKLENKSKIINYPSYVNPTFDDKKDQDAIEEFEGRESPGYQIQILGKVIEGFENTYDIERVRQCYNEKKHVKSFEINKDNFYNYKEIVIVDKPVNIEKTFIALDVGEGAAPTEIIVIFLMNGIYYYTYNITTMKLAPEEEIELIDYLMVTLGVNITAIDVTSGGGKAIASALTKKYPKPGQVIWISFNEKLPIDYERDENSPTGEYKRDGAGKLIFKEEYVSVWSVQRLKVLLYKQKMSIPKDYKFDTQFSNIISFKSGFRTQFKGKGADHLHQAFTVFSISEWQTENMIVDSVETEKNSLNF